MRRPTRPAAIVATLSVLVAGCSAAPSTGRQASKLGVTEAPQENVAAPTNPAPLPFRLPCGENDLEGCTKGCDDRVIEDCTTLGIIYYEGKGIDANPTRGIELFRAACLEDSARACIRLADLYHAAVLTDDPYAEARLYGRACDAGANRGCLGAGRTYLQGRGVERNAERAAKYFAQVCERGNAEACLELAKLHDSGEGVKKDPSRAMALYTKACQLGLAEACVTADPKGEIDAAPPRE
jgi:TPR repeat protein